MHVQKFSTSVEISNRFSLCVFPSCTEEKSAFGLEPTLKEACLQLSTGLRMGMLHGP